MPIDYEVGPLQTGKITAEGGMAIRLANGTAGASVKGYLVSASTSADSSVRLTPVGIPDSIGAFYETGIPSGQQAWIVVSGIADVYCAGAATRGYFCRVNTTTDAGYATGYAVTEAVPSTPFATDNHFREIGHCIVGTTAAGLARIVMHFN